MRKSNSTFPTFEAGTLLRRAAAEGDMDTFKTLLDERYINNTSSNGNTALHWSIENKHYAITKLLLTRPSIRLDIANHRGHTPFHLAVKQGDKKTVYRLLKKGAGHKNNIDKEGFSPLDRAFAKSASFISTKLKEVLPKMTFKDENKLAEQAYERFKANNPLLIRNAQIFDPYYLFNEKLAQYFLPGNSYTLAALKKAVAKGILNPHKLFCSGNLLQSAAVSRVDTLEKFRWLLEEGVDPNLQASHELNPSSYKNTALHTLIANESEKEALALIDLLINYASQPFNFNLADSEKKTCLCLAVKVGQTQVASKLIHLKANVNIPDEDGNTPLHYAFLLGHASIAEELIKNQSDKSAKNKENQTPYELLTSSDIEDVRDCLEISWINPDREIGQSKKTYIQQCMENREIIANQYKAMANVNNCPALDQEVSKLQKRKSIAFLVAAATGDLSTLQENCDEYTLNAPNAKGNTALHLACEQGHPKILSYLLNQPRIDLHKRNNENKKARDLLSHSFLQSFFMERLLSALERTTEARKEICSQAQRKRKSIVFLVAAATGDLSTLQENCDEYTLNASNAKGNTALHLACEQGHDKIVQYLLNQPSIDLHKRNNENKKAVDLLRHSFLSTFFIKKLLAVRELITEERKETYDRLNQRIQTFKNETASTLKDNPSHLRLP